MCGHYTQVGERQGLKNLSLSGIFYSLRIGEPVGSCEGDIALRNADSERILWH